MMTMMRIQIHCPKCGKVEEIDHEPDQKEIKNTLGIPLPNANNGLTTFSLAHSDHTLVIDVDHNGDVRGEKVIDRIDRNLEKTLAAISLKILDRVISQNQDDEEDPISFIFITQNRMIHSLLLGIFQHLIFNIPNRIQSLMSVSKKEALMEYADMTFYVGDWDAKIYNFCKGKSTIIYDLDHHNTDQVKLYLTKDVQMNFVQDFVVLFDSKFIAEPEGKKFIQELYHITPQIQMLDSSNNDKAAKSLFSVLSSVL
jgi:hypothetical protein